MKEITDDEQQHLDDIVISIVKFLGRPSERDIRECIGISIGIKKVKVTVYDVRTMIDRLCDEHRIMPAVVESHGPRYQLFTYAFPPADFRWNKKCE